MLYVSLLLSPQRYPLFFIVGAVAAVFIASWPLTETLFKNKSVNIPPNALTPDIASAVKRKLGMSYAAPKLDSRLTGAGNTPTHLWDFMPWHVVAASACLPACLPARVHTPASLGECSGCLFIALCTTGADVAMIHVPCTPFASSPPLPTLPPLLPLLAGPIDDELNDIINYLIRDCVLSWYNSISPDQAFPTELKKVLREAIVITSSQCKQIDWVYFLCVLAAARLVCNCNCNCTALWLSVCVCVCV